MDVELVARTSLSSFQKEAGEGLIASPNNLDDWTWNRLRKQFKYKSLEKLFSIYQRRIQNGYLSLFIILELIVRVMHCTIVISQTTVSNSIPDIVIYCLEGALLCPIITLSFNSKSFAKRPYLPVVLSCTIITILVVTDLAIPLYYGFVNAEEIAPLRPAHMSHAILTCYVFLPLTENLHALILGIAATLCYLTVLFMVTYRNMPDYIERIATDAIYAVCVNGLGLYLRFLNEVVIRRSFLDRRKCVESTLRLNYEKDQEEQLTRSIIPPHFAAKIKKDFRDIFKFIEVHKKPPLQGMSKKDLYVETHENVSILYADVVNFSGLTVTLPVTKLVRTLNDLFGSFDEASERHNVLRIKFLGDCYYCVSGVPLPNSHHAKSCVDLGLDMIKIIKEVKTKVRRESGVDVDMRIGVHSGKIISGILGTNKWQYDVWSRDVVIANKMEQTGEPGKVHVTEQTLNLLDRSQYECEPVKNLKDETLGKYGIRKSYLISPAKPSKPLTHVRVLAPNSENLAGLFTRASKEVSPAPNKHYIRWSNAKPSSSIGSSSIGASLRSTKRQTLTIINDHHPEMYATSCRRRTHFMDSCLRDYHLMLKAADVEMEKAIKQMPLSKWEQWFKGEHINPFFLSFKNSAWEIPFMREPDFLFKFYIVCAALVLFSMILILLIPTFYFTEWHSKTPFVYFLVMFLLLLLLPVTWMHFIWNRYRDPQNEYEGSVPQPRNKLLLILYQSSIKVVSSSILRMSLYIIMIMMLALCAMFRVLFECKNEDKLKENNVTSSIAEVGASNLHCISTPWQITETCSLAILSSFLFLRVHFFLKLTVGVAIMTFYIYIVSVYRSSIFQSGDTWNPYLEPQFAHIMSVVFLTVTLHLIDRQAEYLSRLDYQWKRQLTMEQDEAYHTRTANKILLRNILPEHVAEFYLNVNRTEDNELYHEAHENVAVMFASLTNLCPDESCILVDLNEIICAFDKLLYEPMFASTVEKIKIAGTTYMAACGLESCRRDSFRSDENSEYDEHQDHVVKVMAQFAAQMIAVLDKLLAESFPTSKPYKLRIGISHGEVTAGVVGAHKPLYDIWGDAVNMASRMDTTGIPGKIQVTGHTAAVLDQHEVKCELRGDTWVKGKGLVPTYFVSIDENRQLRKTSTDETTSM